MRRIERMGEPPKWTAYIKKNPNAQYRDLDKDEEGITVRKILREHLVRSQYYLCAYCCRRIEPSGEDSLNEHIKPQGIARYSRYSMCYDNIVASCNRQENQPTCSAKKKNDYDEKRFVSPLQEDCEEHFAFAPNGEIMGTTEKGDYTCNLLGLNSYVLKEARKATYKTAADYHDENLVKEVYLMPHEGRLAPFADMIKYFYDRGYFAENT